MTTDKDSVCALCYQGMQKGSEKLETANKVVENETLQ